MSFDVGFLCHCQWFWVVMGGNANADLDHCIESIEDVLGGGGGGGGQTEKLGNFPW